MRIKWRNFSKGLYASGSREAVPPGAARRLKGFDGAVNADYIRLRRAHQGRIIVQGAAAPLAPPGAPPQAPLHSLTSFVNDAIGAGNDDFNPLTRIYYGYGRGFGYGTLGPVNQAPNPGTDIFSHASNALNGERLSFFTGRPVAGKGEQGGQDFLYVCGGGVAFKVRRGVDGLSRWGLPAPTTPLIGSERGVRVGENYFRPPMMNFDTTAGWYPDSRVHGGDDFSVVDDNPDNVQTSGSLRFIVGNGKVGRVKGVFADVGANPNFSQFGPGFPSSEQDWIVLYVKVKNIINFETLEIRFSDTPIPPSPHHGDEADSYFTFTVVMDDPLVRETTSGANGLGDIGEIGNNQTSFVGAPPDATSGTNKDIVERMGVLKLSGQDNTWTLLKIPKSAFAYQNATAAGRKTAWASITAIEFLLTTNKNDTDTGHDCEVRLNSGTMFGGVGMQGRYKYCYTFKDPVTKHRSNPSPILIVDTLFRAGVNLFVQPAPATDPEKPTMNLPLSSSAQPLTREVWRTMGNGSVFFKLVDIPYNPASAMLVVDRVADYQGLHDLPPPNSLATPVETDAFGVLKNEVLTFDNIVPAHTITDIFGLAYGRVFTTRDLDPGHVAGGRVYYSPPGRLESVQGFIDVVGVSGDQCQKGVIWNGIYVFTQKRMFEIVGTDEPFQAREVLGVPGTLWPKTVVPTPYGIIYEALDGIRVFDGSGSQLLAMPPVEVFFRRDTNARIEAGIADTFQTTINHYACFVLDEYRWSDGATALAYNLRTGTWRQMDAAPLSWYVTPITECLAGAKNGVITSWEFSSIGSDYTLDPLGGFAIPYDFETPGAIVDGRQTFLVQRVYLDVCLPEGAVMHVNVRVNDFVPGLGPVGQDLVDLVGIGQRKLYEVNVPCTFVAVPSVRLWGASTTTGALRIHGVEMDVHIPEQPGDGT